MKAPYLWSAIGHFLNGSRAFEVYRRKREAMTVEFLPRLSKYLAHLNEQSDSIMNKLSSRITSTMTDGTRDLGRSSMKVGQTVGQYFHSGFRPCLIYLGYLKFKTH